MKSAFSATAFAATALVAFALPVAAQDDAGVPLIRVYIDAPYFYELVARQNNFDDPGAQSFHLVVEGKEVGTSEIVIDCVTGEYAETVTSDWTGKAADFVPAAIKAYENLYC